jgi:plasmid stability protein
MEAAMKSITIHGLDDPLDKRIRERAQREGLSLNRTIKKLLAESLGLRPDSEEARRRDFLDLFGTWSQGDVREFMDRIAAFEKIDEEDWA